MEKEDLDERAKQEIESEALLLERRVNTKKELASLKMSEDSYEKLMNTIWEKEKLKCKKRSLHRKTLATAATVALLITAVGLGVNGARLYILDVGSQSSKGRLDITANTQDILYVELSEEEAYEKIEEEIGILSLRLTDKPKGMELKKVYIDAEMGEALMEFCYDSSILTIYENKQNSNASFNIQSDGEVIDVIEIFHLGENIDIIETNKEDGEEFYTIQLEFGNAYYYITSDIELKIFEDIVCGIMFINT